MSSELTARAPGALGPGALALVVGASGVGKDALIAGARAQLGADARFVFPERTVTRAAHGAEDHSSMSETAFAEAERQDRFAITWEAHGLRYGIPAALDEAVRQGRTGVINGSRATVPMLRRRYARTRVILVECPIEIRAARLALRGREDPASVEERLMRKVAAFDPADADVRIDNSGPLEAGIRALVEALQSLAKA